VEAGRENPFLTGKPDAIIPEDELPFWRTRVTPADDQEDAEGSVKTGQFFQKLSSTDFAHLSVKWKLGSLMSLIRGRHRRCSSKFPITSSDLYVPYLGQGGRRKLALKPQTLHI
jgi:hypothetical protein